MTSMNYCTRKGWLVAARFPLPDHPREFSFGSPVIGCNHLRCDTCGQRVRSQVGVRMGSAGPDVLAATQDWTELLHGGGVIADSRARLYACGCSRYTQEVYYRALDDAELNVLDPAPTGWRCAGHPPVTLPLALDGVVIDASTDMATWAAASLAGTPLGTPPACVKGVASQEAERLYRWVGGTPVAQKLSAAVGDLLDSSDPAVRVAAARFFEAVPDAPDANRLAACALEDPDSWRGVQHPSRPTRTMTEPLGCALAPQVLGGTGRALEAARAIALWPDRTPALLLDALVAADPMWMAVNAADILRATPTDDVLADLLYAMAPIGTAIEAPAVAMWRTGALDAPTFRQLADILLKGTTRERVLAAVA